jgi:hypothetical protein
VVEIKLPPGNDSHCFWIHGQICYFVALLYPKKANKPGYGQPCISNSAKATTKQPENQ